MEKKSDEKENEIEKEKEGESEKENERKGKENWAAVRQYILHILFPPKMCNQETQWHYYKMWKG